MSGDCVDVHPPTDHRNRILASEDGSQIDILDVVDDVQVRRAVGVPRQVKNASLQDIIAEKDFALIEIGNNQIEIINELGAGGGIAGRIGPNQGNSQRLPICL